MTAIPRWAARYIGLLWRDGGRSFDGVDCEGLCRLVLKNDAGNPPIPPTGVVSADGLLKVARAIKSTLALPPFVSVMNGGLQPFDLVVMTGREKVDGRPRTLDCHLGIMATERIVLHIEQATDSVAVPLSYPSIRHRIVGFIRHEALA